VALARREFRLLLDERSPVPRNLGRFLGELGILLLSGLLFRHRGGFRGEGGSWRHREGEK
jgi:hypothetical protein